MLSLDSLVILLRGIFFLLLVCFLGSDETSLPTARIPQHQHPLAPLLDSGHGLRAEGGVWEFGKLTTDSTKLKER